MSTKENTFMISLLAGAVAGTVTDITLYPLDTIKTRIQSSQGLWKSGGFRGIYKGLSAAAVGSAPGAALFFSTYDSLKQQIGQTQPNLSEPSIHMIAASTGEVMACLVRVPTEVIKQRMQVGQGSIIQVFRNIIHSPTGILGIYTGFGITIMREIPFAMIQFPLYEWLKNKSKAIGKNRVPSYEAAIYGSISGGVAAAITTPLDVLKTRVMTAEKTHGSHKIGLFSSAHLIFREEGLMAFAKGIGPRVMWISIGGYVFLGAYEQSKHMLETSWIS